jgi:hypothetical protein
LANLSDSTLESITGKPFGSVRASSRELEQALNDQQIPKLFTVKEIAAPELTPTTPLRLHVAAAIAFPSETMTASGLRGAVKQLGSDPDAAL